MTNQSKESAAKQLRNLKTPSKRWLRNLDRKHMAMVKESAPKTLQIPKHTESIIKET